MAGCTYQNWTLFELKDALQNAHKDNKHIVVPMFQRGLRWDIKRKKSFIDSMQKGFPVGTMLFYETVDGSNRTYILVDGLQRSNCIREYINNPTNFLETTAISDDACSEIADILNIDADENVDDIRQILLNYIQEIKKLKNVQFYSLAKKLATKFDAKDDVIEPLINQITLIFEDLQHAYDKIGNSVIPIIIYTGDADNLPTIFDRINSKGVPLNQYEVYAASWPVDKKFHISNNEILNHVIDKYENFQHDGYMIHGYTRENILSSQEVNAFEYLFGLSKHLTTKYPALSFDVNRQVDEVNPFAFELVNACLNESDKIKELYNNIYSLDIDEFESALIKAIDFVIKSISPILFFKGNQQSSSLKKFHSKFQIMSMISTTFKEMFAPGYYASEKEDWNGKKDKLQKNILHYYIHDILTDFWSEGGTGKIHSIAKPNRYMNDIDALSWKIALDNFFEKSLQRCESRKIALPRSEEYVILNCIYMNRFSAQDQLSSDKFDVEHIAPKKQMQNLIKQSNGNGLPISNIANLCYLPQCANRSKKDRNFYQDTAYLAHIELEEVEQKYSLTTKDELEWMDMHFGADEFDVLKQSYIEFLRNRFSLLKQAFCNSLGIDYIKVDTSLIDNETISLVDDSVSDVPFNSPTQELAGRNLTQYCIKKYQHLAQYPISKVKGNLFSSHNNTKQYFFSSSKNYNQGDREKYWYAYRKGHPWDIDTERYYILGCRQGEILFEFPLDFFESHLINLNFSTEENGDISHWHIVIFIDKDNNATMLLSQPELKEIDINHFIIKSE